MSRSVRQDRSYPQRVRIGAGSWTVVRADPSNASPDCPGPSTAIRDPAAASSDPP